VVQNRSVLRVLCERNQLVQPGGHPEQPASIDPHLSRHQHPRVVDQPVVVGVGRHVGALVGVQAQVEDLGDAQLGVGLRPHTQGALSALLTVLFCKSNRVKIVNGAGKTDSQKCAASTASAVC